jgi:hypothetical protein
MNDIVSVDCSAGMCIRQFDAPLIATLRHEMHHSNSRTKDVLRLGVHRKSYIGTTVSKSISMLEGREVCIDAWRKIYGVSKFDFYKYKGYTRSGLRVQYHGSKGRKKVSMRKEQVVQTMKM